MRAQKSFVFLLNSINVKHLLSIWWRVSRTGREWRWHVAQEAGSIVGFNEKSVDSIATTSKFISQNLTYNRHCIHHDEWMNQKACEWVRENAFKKRAPNIIMNMSPSMYCHLIFFLSFVCHPVVASHGFQDWAWEKRCCEAQNLVLESNRCAS